MNADKKIHLVLKSLLYKEINCAEQYQNYKKGRFRTMCFSLIKDEQQIALNTDKIRLAASRSKNPKNITT